MSKKNETMERLESQLAKGLDRALDSIVEWLRTILVKDQKRTDYKPSEDAMAEVIDGPSTLVGCTCCPFE